MPLFYRLRPCFEGFITIFEKIMALFYRLRPSVEGFITIFEKIMALFYTQTHTGSAPVRMYCNKPDNTCETVGTIL